MDGRDGCQLTRAREVVPLPLDDETAVRLNGGEQALAGAMLSPCPSDQRPHFQRWVVNCPQRDGRPTAWASLDNIVALAAVLMRGSFPTEWAETPVKSDWEVTCKKCRFHVGPDWESRHKPSGAILTMPTGSRSFSGNERVSPSENHTESSTPSRNGAKNRRHSDLPLRGCPLSARDYPRPTLQSSRIRLTRQVQMCACSSNAFAIRLRKQRLQTIQDQVRGQLGPTKHGME